MYDKKELTDTVQDILLLTPENLLQQVDVVNNIIQNNTENKSVLDVLSQGWDYIPWWGKGIFLALLSIPTILVAALLQLWIVLAVTAAVALVFITISLLLDNHAHIRYDTQNILLSKVMSFVQFLSAAITELFAIKEGLKQEVSDFELENARLNAQVAACTVEIQTLALQNNQYKTTLQVLEGNQQCFQSTIATLEKDKNKKNALIENYEAELQSLRAFHVQEKTAFDAEKFALSQTTTTLQMQIADLTTKAQILADCHKGLIALTAKRHASVKDFDEKLDGLFQEQTCVIQNQTQKMIRAQAEIEGVITQAQQLNREYANIIQQDRNTFSLDAIMKSCASETPKSLPRDAFFCEKPSFDLGGSDTFTTPPVLSCEIH